MRFDHFLSGAENEQVKRAMMGATPWHRSMYALIGQHRIIIAPVGSADGNYVAVHLAVHSSDAKLQRLGRQYGFPRGFCLVIRKKPVPSLVGQGTFYPKFGNDSRNNSFSLADFGGVEKLSCFLQYSGSVGIVSLIRDGPNGRISGWTASSKNSANQRPRPDGVTYPLRIGEIVQPYMTQRLLQWCDEHGIESFSMEVFLHEDQSHGYGYAKSGFVVTCMARRQRGSPSATLPMEEGRPEYLTPMELYETCQELQLPTDKPLVIEGEARIRQFVTELSAVRDLLTLPKLMAMLPELETLHHELVLGINLEGFVMRRWRKGVEVDSVKFKCWPYQLATQVLRPLLTGGENVLSYSGALISLRKSASPEPNGAFCRLVEMQMRRWVVLRDETVRSTCRWLAYKAAESCLPPNHPHLQWTAHQHDGRATEMPNCFIPEGCLPRNTREAYWITLITHAVTALQSRMDAVAGHVERLGHTQGITSVEAISPQYVPGEQVVLVPVGIPGIGKSTMFRALAYLLENEAFYDTQDNHHNARAFFASLSRRLQANRGAPGVRVILADRNHQQEFHRKATVEALRQKLPPRKELFVIYVDFVGEQDLGALAEVAIDRVMRRGAQHQKLRSSLNVPGILHDTFVDKLERLTDEEIMGAVASLEVDSFATPIHCLTQVVQQLRVLGVLTWDPTPPQLDWAMEKSNADAERCTSMPSQQRGAAAPPTPTMHVLTTSPECIANALLSLGEDLGKQMLPGDWTQAHAFHVTLGYYRGKEPPLTTPQIESFVATLEGRSFPVVLVSLVYNEKGAALEVQLPDSVRGWCRNLVPHITLATASGVPPVYSNELLSLPRRSVRVVHFPPQTSMTMIACTLYD